MNSGERKHRERRHRGNGKTAIVIVVIAVLAIVGIAFAASKSGAGKQSETEKNQRVAKEEQKNETTPAQESGISQESTTSGEDTQSGETSENETEVLQETTPAVEETTSTYPVAGQEPFVFEDTGETKLAYLTFDDGPSDNTDQILSILDQYGVKATFFMIGIGKDDEASLQRYKAIAEKGHGIALHSFTHDYGSIYASIENFAADVQQIHDWVLQTTGVDTRIYRFPGGSSNTVANIDIQQGIDYLTSIGYRYFDWNVSSGDATGKPITAEEITQNVLSGSADKTRAVILMHDTNAKGETVRALPAIIEGLQSMGFQIVPITDTTKPVQHVKASYMQ